MLKNLAFQRNQEDLDQIEMVQDQELIETINLHLIKFKVVWSTLALLEVDVGTNWETVLQDQAITLLLMDSNMIVTKVNQLEELFGIEKDHFLQVQVLTVSKMKWFDTKVSKPSFHHQWKEPRMEFKLRDPQTITNNHHSSLGLPGSLLARSCKIPLQLTFQVLVSIHLELMPPELGLQMLK